MGGASPPITNMKLALKIAKIVAFLLKARNEKMSKKIGQLVDENVEFADRLMALKEESTLYKEMVTSLDSQNQELQDRVMSAKAWMGSLKTEENELALKLSKDLENLGKTLNKSI